MDPAGGGTYAIEWRPKFAHDASTVAASLPDDGLDLTGLAGALERQPTGGISATRTSVSCGPARAPGG